MDQKQLQELDRELAAEEETLTKQIKEVGVENPSVKGDFEPTMPNYDQSDNTEDDRINEATDLDRNVAMEQQLEKRLKEIRSVREQIANGKYGTCLNCASPISSERLDAIPSAVLCISCAQRV
jgi:DnaK suppressor protein